MSTATEDVCTNTAQTTRAGVLDRGAGRIDLTKAGNPGLDVRQAEPERRRGRPPGRRDFTVRPRTSAAPSHVGRLGGRDGRRADGELRHHRGHADPRARRRRHAASFPCTSTAAGAAAGNYQGKVVLVNRASGQAAACPRLAARAAAARAWTCCSSTTTARPRRRLRRLLRRLQGDARPLGVTYEYLDMCQGRYPSFFQPATRALLIFTGDNDSFDTSGFFATRPRRDRRVARQRRKLWTTGQNFARPSDSGRFHSRPRPRPPLPRLPRAGVRGRQRVRHARAAADGNGPRPVCRDGARR